MYCKFPAQSTECIPFEWLGGTAAPLLQRLEGGAAAAASHPAAAAPAAASGVDEAARQRSRAHLAKALTANARLGLDARQAAAAAQVCRVQSQLLAELAHIGGLLPSDRAVTLSS